VRWRRREPVQGRARDVICLYAPPGPTYLALYDTIAAQGGFPSLGRLFIYALRGNPAGL
jgi:hypothetical protein